MVENDKRKIVYRLPPCPDYDVEGMESWLTEMSRQGFHLCEDGFFCGIASFEKSVPKSIRYRLMADLDKRSWLDSDFSEDNELRELQEKYGWEFVAKRGDFFICRSDSADLRELNTDPDVHALAIQTVTKRYRSAVITDILWMILYPLLKIRGNILLTMIHIGTAYSVFTLALILEAIIGATVGAVGLSRFRKKLLERNREPVDRDWKSISIRNHIQKAAKILVLVIWCCITLSKIGDALLGEDEIPLETFGQDTPFSTMEDFVSGQGNEYDLQKYGFANTVTVWSDGISKVNYRWEEMAQIRMVEGTTLDGALYLDYHELITEQLAEMLGKEYHKLDRSKRDYTYIGTLDLGIDESFAYYNEIHQPTVVLRNGNKLIHASFSDFGKETQFALEEWSAILADSIK